MAQEEQRKESKREDPMMKTLGSGPQKLTLSVKDPQGGISRPVLVFSNLRSLTPRALLQFERHSLVTGLRVAQYT